MKHRLPFILLLLSLWAVRPVAWAQAVDPSFAPVNVYFPAVVYAAAQQPDGKYVVSGNFARVNGAAASTIVRLNADGTTDASFASVLTTRSTAVSLTVLPSGHILAFTTGSFSVNGQTYANVLKLNPDGTVASGFSTGTGAVGVVRAMTVQPDGKVLLAGGFSSFNGTPSRGLVRLNADGSIDQPFLAEMGTGFISEVYVVALEATGRILVGGRFNGFNNSGRRVLLRLQSTGALDTSYNPPVTNNTTQVVGLAIDPVTDQAVVHGLNSELSRLNTNGTVDGSFFVTTPAYCISASVYSNTKLVVDNARRVVLARGCVTTATTGPGSQYLTRYRPDGTVDTQLSGLPSANVNVVVRQADGQLLLGGSFMLVGTTTAAGLARITEAGSLDATFRPVLDATGSVQKIVRQPDGKLLVAGSFREVNGQPATSLLRLNPDGTPDATFGFPAVDENVLALTLQPDGKILIGGPFLTVAGVSSPSVARLLANGSFDPTFTSYATTRSAITALVVQPDGAILVGSRSGVTLNGRSAFLHRLQANGTPDASYGQGSGANPSGSVADVVLLPDGRHYVGGFFSQVNSQPVEGIVRLLPTGALDPAFALAAVGSMPNVARSVVRILPLNNGQVLVGGAFNDLRGLARTNLVRLNADGSADAGLNANLSGSQLTDLYEQPDGKILVGALSNHQVASVSRGVLFRLNSDGALDNTFTAGASQIDGAVQTLLVQPDGKLLVGGSFAQVYGQSRQSLARLVAPNVLHVANAQLAARTQSWPVPAHHELHLSLDAVARPQSVRLLDNLGRTVMTRKVAQATLALPLQTLPAGVYLLRVEYADGPVTRRIVVE